MVETSLSSDFISKDDAQAVKDAFRHADNRVKALGGEKEGFYKEMRVGCVKVYHRFVGPIDPAGNVTSQNGFPIFEWKYDWPSTREQAIESFSKPHRL